MSAEVSGGGQRPHGRYYTELLPPSPERGLQATVQELLDAGERKEWHLVGVAGGLPESGVLLFGIQPIPASEEPSFGKFGEVTLRRGPDREAPALYFAVVGRPATNLN